MSLLNHLLAASAPLFTRIAEHPFNQALSRGDLKPQVFQYFVTQDQPYLHEFSHTLKHIASQLQNTPYQQQFTQLHEESVAFEQGMLNQYAWFHTSSPKTPALKHYIEHLRQSKRKDTRVTMATILPCFWIYTELGKIMPPPSKDHAYYEWISTYQDPLYVEASTKLMITFDTLTCDITDPVLIQEISDAFSHSFDCEYQFFDDCFYERSETPQPHTGVICS